MKGKLYINEFCALNVPTGPHYGHGKGVIKAEKNWAYLFPCNTQTSSDTLCTMTALSRHSILCVYHASLLLEVILMGEVQANIEDNLVQQMFQALFVILCPLWKVKIIFLSGL